MAFVHFATVLSILAFITCGNAIKCWTCSSDLDPHCSDPFNHTSPAFNLHHTLTDCSTQSSPHYTLYRTKSVCKKLVQTINNHQAVVRSCEWLKSEDDTVGECSSATYVSPKYITVDHCSTCDYDGCNSADSLYNAYFWKALIPAAFALLLCY